MLLKYKTWLKLSACFGFVMILLSGITLVFVDDIYRHIVNKMMVLSPHSPRYGPWQKSHTPLIFRVYLFNWTNPEELLKGGKPRLVEMGPYTFSEYDEKVDLQWHENHTVSYRQTKMWYFEPEQSNGTLDDLVTTVDIVALTAAEVAEGQYFWYRRFVSSSTTLLSYKLYATHKVGEMLFDGYADRLLQVLTSASYFSAQDSDTEMFPHTSFGFFYQANGSSAAEGIFNVATGAGDISEIGLVKKWNYSNHTRYFPGDCGIVKGTSGEMWPPWMTKNDTISLFAKGLCSVLNLEYEDESVVEGITGYRYVPVARTFDNGSMDDESRCYCVDKCMPSGALSIKACKFGSPMYLSFPHFYGADPYYVHQLEGVRPTEDRHKFSMTIEPNTGVPLQIFGRTQFSMLLESKRYNRLFQDVPTVLLPVMWVEVAWRLSPDKAAELSLLLGVKKALHYGCLVLLALDAAIIIVSTLLLVRQSQSPELPKNAEESETARKENKILLPSSMHTLVKLKAPQT